MRLLKSFQDLQNETCEIEVDDLGNYWVGRIGTKKMNISFEMIEQIFKLAEYENKQE
jgi:hypothetical protein